ncbi:bile acid:sodium symporter family protein [Luedemannella helvata]|uniref:Bile acid:sodium symporter n=1 Tax=Luedemannella helvata TaxID=349315 RepID=A0ABP4VXH7_9ACTN
MRWPSRLPIDPFIAALLATVVLATLVPARGEAAGMGRVATTLAIALVFFLHGARITPRAALAGARHWRLHVVVLLTTYAVFPLIGLAAAPLRPDVLTPELYQGLLFLCAVPSTVQTSIAFTAIAGGNVPAAVFSASFSNLAGVVLTPLLATALLHDTGAVQMSAGAVGTVLLQILVPFALGQLARPLIGTWIDRHRTLTGWMDRGSVLLVVYMAFSAGVVAGVWDEVSPIRLATLIAVVCALLALALGLTYTAGRLFRFDRADRATILFCGSQKSLATGLPIAAVLVSPQLLGLLVLPLMVYHQIQLAVCASLARRWGAREE